MFGKRKTRLTAEGWYYLFVIGFLLAGALLREINLLLVVFGLMLALLGLNWRHVAVSFRKVRFRRRHSPTIAAGDPLVIDICGVNGRRRGSCWAVAVEDTIRRQNDGLSPVPARVVFTRLPPGAETVEAYQGRLVQRGRYALGPLRVATRFPLGLVRRSEVIDENSTLLVLPRQGRLTPRWRQRNALAYHGSRSHQDRHGHREGDFHSLRDYRSGDSRHWIHWRTTARQGELMVRQFEEQQAQDLALFLDLGPRPLVGTAGDNHYEDNVELAVSFAATVLADECRRGGSHVLLGIAGDEPSLIRGPASSALLAELLEALALAESPQRDRLPELLKRGVEQVPWHGDAVLITTRDVDLTGDPRFAGLWTDSRQQAWLDRLLVINSGTDELFTYFQTQ